MSDKDALRFARLIAAYLEDSISEDEHSELLAILSNEENLRLFEYFINPVFRKQVKNWQWN